MILHVRLFAVLRERAGADQLEIDVAEGATVADALRALAEQHRPLAAPLAEMEVVMAVNRSYAREDEQLTAGDELALIPPVSGGAEEQDIGPLPGDGTPHVRVTPEPLSAERLTTVVATNHSGAIVTFQGTTRDVERLDYEAYEPMASEQIEAILTEVAARHEVEGIAAEHRTGAVPLGEPSVVVAVASAHRGPAFAAAREAIDRIKAEAPIWKREMEGQEGRWVEGTPPPA
ncbi:MAG TPA: molybdopterin converting factor subunit 1 [Solirubrobacterales bacterium]|jgi:molybdopterin synthase catalytic subunit|nr:molybdopterin converting factor subunit 1 [Solirubrobacterales bacterium]